MKKFNFRFVVAYTYDITLNEDQIYPDYPWHLSPEHVNARKKKRVKLTAAHVMKTIQAHGGPSAVLRAWDLGPDFIEGAYPTGDLDPEHGTKLISKRVKLRVRPASKTRAKRRRKKA